MSQRPSKRPRRGGVTRFTFPDGVPDAIFNAHTGGLSEDPITTMFYTKETVNTGGPSGMEDGLNSLPDDVNMIPIEEEMESETCADGHSFLGTTPEKADSQKVRGLSV
jgi:hypothetical protein